MSCLDPFLRDGKNVAQNHAWMEKKNSSVKLQINVNMFHKKLIQREKKRNTSILLSSEILSSRVLKSY